MPKQGMFTPPSIRGVIWYTGLNHVANLLDTDVTFESGEDPDLDVVVGAHQTSFFSGLIFPWYAGPIILNSVSFD